MTLSTVMDVLLSLEAREKQLQQGIACADKDDVFLKLS